MKTLKLLSFLAALALITPNTFAQTTPFQRLATEIFDVVPPSARVQGTPGQMTVKRSACRSLPTAETRRRIVDVAVQEWAFFGFMMVEPEADEFETPGDGRGPRLSPEASARVASSIAGYWAVTPGGPGIVSNQNRAWNGPGGIGVRWNAPWSAAFISWVMCESGLGAGSQFQHAIAHHVYIDQAIRARDGSAPQAAFAAYDPGEAAIEPGDLLCTSRRPVYRNLAERRRQMGEGARSHCDVVVKVDETGERIFAIGGNVQRSVSMKVLPARRERGKHLRPFSDPANTRARAVFAHLKLRAKPIELSALDSSPTIRALPCKALPQSARVAAPNSATAAAQRC